MFLKINKQKFFALNINLGQGENPASLCLGHRSVSKPYYQRFKLGFRHTTGMCHLAKESLVNLCFFVQWVLA